jgi:hypothetical protein
MPFSDAHHGRRRFIAIVVALAVNAAALGGMVIRFVDYRTDQQRTACQRAMDARQGQRTMWEYLVEQRPADDPEAVAFVVELNKRLPPYVCVDNVPTPAYPPDPD